MRLNGAPIYRLLLCGMGCAVISSCTGPSLPAAQAQAPSVTVHVSSALVVAVRGGVQAANPAMTKLIMAAVGEAPPASGPAADEVILRRPDGSIVSVVQRQSAGQNEFVPGESVSITAAGETVLEPN